MKYKGKIKDCRLIIKAKTSYGENIDEQMLDRFARNCFPGFFRPKLVKKNVIEYTGPVAVPLQERLKKPITKHDFFFIMEHIVVGVQKLQKNHFDLRKLVLDLQNVYINEVTKEVRFLYIPVMPDRASVDVIAFMESIIYSAIPAEEHDKEYISRFVYFLKGLKTFDDVAIEKYISKEDRSVVNTIRKNNMGQSGFMTSNHAHRYEYQQKQKREQRDWDDVWEEDTEVLEEDIPTVVLEDEDTVLLDDVGNGVEEPDTDLLWDTADSDEEDATSLLFDPLANPLEDDEEDEDEGTMCLFEEDAEEEETALLDEDEPIRYSAKVHYPVLYRVLTEERIRVNKPVFRIGKERSYVDYFVANNNAVSRSHADIITRGQRYYVMDQNSKNRTYINGEALPVKYEVEIHNGDSLRLANEEFIFYV